MHHAYLGQAPAPPPNMGRPIAGQYRVPLRDKRGLAVIDAAMMTAHIGDRRFGYPVFPDATRNMISEDVFWQILRDCKPMHVKDSDSRVYIKLEKPWKNGVQVIRMNLVYEDEQVVTVRA